MPPKKKNKETLENPITKDVVLNDNDEQPTETAKITTTDTNPKTNKVRIENGAVVIEGAIDAVSSSTETNGVQKNTVKFKDGAVVSEAAPDKVEETPKRKRGRPRKVKLEDGVVVMNPTDKNDKEDE